MTCSLRFKECGALRGKRVRKQKQWVHDANPLKIGCREVLSRAQVSAAGLVTLPNIELLFMYKEQALESIATPALKQPTQALSPAVMRGGARSSNLATAALHRFFENQALKEATKGNRLAKATVRFVLQGTLAAFLNPCRLSAVRV